MKKLICITALVLVLSCSQKNNPESVVVLNSGDLPRTDAFVEIPLKDQLPLDYGLMAIVDEDTLPTQLIDRDFDGLAESAAFVLDLAGNGEELVRFALDSKEKLRPQRAYAEISVKHDAVLEDGLFKGGKFKNVKHFRVPDEHVAHDGLIRYEGPGWESDKVAYRFYLDGRNAIDIFGKKTNARVLPQIDTDNSASYHEMQPWGMDLLKVGNSLGIGSIAAFTEDSLIHFEKTDSVHCRVRADGPVYAEVETDWFGWQPSDMKVQLTSVLSISAGKRTTMHDIKTNFPGTLCTGLVKNPDMEMIVKRSEDEPWEAIATWGAQSLSAPQDSLGLALFYRKADVKRLAQSDHSYIVVFKDALPEFSYAFGACWDKEPSGITTGAAFEMWVEQTLAELNQPVAINEDY